MVVLLKSGRAIQIKDEQLRSLIPVQLLQIIVGHPEGLLGAAVIIGCDPVAVIEETGIDVTVDMAGTEKHDINAVFLLPV